MMMTNMSIKKVCICQLFHHNAAGRPYVICPMCNWTMNHELLFVDPVANDQVRSDGAGFVKGVVIYMIMETSLFSTSSMSKKLMHLRKRLLRKVCVKI